MALLLRPLLPDSIVFRLNVVEVSKDNRFVCGGFSDSTIKLWDITQTHTRNFGTVIKRKENGVLIEEQGNEDYHVFAGHSGPIYGLSISPENKFLLSSSEDSTGERKGALRHYLLTTLQVRLWSLETKSNLVCYKGHNYPVWDVDFSPLGYYFASASHDRTARIWGTDNIFPLRILAGHLSDVDVSSLTSNFDLLLIPRQVC
jgi:transcription initiation factor TFIID subunit 5